jgi:hypothetical protein
MSGTLGTVIKPGPLERVGLGIEEHLGRVFPANRFAFEWLPAKVTKSVWQKLMRRAPVIGLGFNRIGNVETSSGFGATTEWSVYLAVSNERSAKDRLVGDPLGIGLLPMMAVAGAVLNGRTLPDLGTISVREITHAFTEDFEDDSVAIGALELHVKLDMAPINVFAGVPATAMTADSYQIEWLSGGEALLTDIIAGEP